MTVLSSVQSQARQGEVPITLPIALGLLDGLVAAAVALLGLALVTVGYRTWGLAVPLALIALPLTAGRTFVSMEVWPGANDGAATPGWGSGLVIGLVLMLPAVLAAVAPLVASGGPEQSPAPRRRISTGTALRRSGVAAAIIAAGGLLWDAVSSTSSTSTRYSLAVQVAIAVVIVSTGLLAAALPARHLRPWAVVALTLLVAHSLVMLVALRLTGLWSPWSNLSGLLHHLLVLAAGPVAVLATPAVRARTSTFRHAHFGGAGTSGSTAA
ncbi:hypothetical protein ACGIF2_10955 [Cellulomonas sp. P22]|uniref:hypothetical protein n=1 Tax=Cellulomonas sp. P22 TaxID=3373189 RepID=UPI003799507F